MHEAVHVRPVQLVLQRCSNPTYLLRILLVKWQTRGSFFLRSVVLQRAQFRGPALLPAEQRVGVRRRSSISQTMQSQDRQRHSPPALNLSVCQLSRQIKPLPQL